MKFKLSYPKIVLTFCALLAFTNISADVGNEAEILDRVNSMTVNQLSEQRGSLIAERSYLQDQDKSTQSPAKKKEISNRLSAINFELTQIQKILLGLGGVALISNLTSDGYNDDVPPVITVLGNSSITVELGDSYSDAGAEATDANHGSTNVTTSSDVDMSTVGSYTVTYSATDLSGNTATATRTVIVEDTTAPTITIAGDALTIIELGTTYTDAGASATDASGTVTVTTTGLEVISGVPSVASYDIVYTSSDVSGNTATATRTVQVADTTGPTITIAGDALTIVELGSSYTDAGASATDASGTVTVTTTGLELIGTIPSVASYDVVYTSTDTYGNTSTATRTVQVADTTGPTITIAGDALTIVELGSSYTDAGASATDVSGAVTVTTTGLELIGTIPSLASYDVVYTSTDTYGNTSTATRTVQVASIAPVFTSQEIFNADENQTVIGTVTATDATAVTFTISGSELSITSAGVLSFTSAPDFETKSTYTATVSATDTYSTVSTQDITVNVNDVGGWDDNPATGTGTDSSVGSGSGSGTGSN